MCLDWNLSADNILEITQNKYKEIIYILKNLILIISIINLYII